MPGIARGGAQFGGDITGEQPTILIRSHLDAFDVANISRAKGAVVAEGGLLSHGAILVRELGVPCVIGVRPQPVPVEDGEQVVLDATRGALFAASNISPPALSSAPNASDRIAEQGEQLWTLKPRLEPCDVAELKWHVSEELRARLSSGVTRTLERLRSVPGVVDTVHVLPDIRSRVDHGFVSGVSFRSLRLHPTAIGDIGDGIAIVAIEGVDTDEVSARIQDLAHHLLQILHRHGHASADLLSQIWDGPAALKCSRWIDRRPEDWSFSHNGRLAGADPSALPVSVRRLAADELERRDMQPGHFLDVLRTPDGERAVLLLHTGFDQATAAFNAWAHEVGRTASEAEGIDMPASPSGHFWGLDPAQTIGERILRGAAALVNGAFCRRELLLERCGEAFANVFGQRIRLRHISNWAHSLLAVDQDAIQYQQGVQVVAAESRFNDEQAVNHRKFITELAITGGPLGSTWLMAIPSNPTFLLPHGRSYVVEAPLAEPAPEPPLLIGRLDSHEPKWEIAQAQTLLSVRETMALNNTLTATEFVSMLTMRGGRRAGSATI
jgi:phosphohistidine swiveling domain-containing protein